MPNTQNERKYFDVKADFDPQNMSLDELSEAHEELRRYLVKISWEIATRKMASHKHNNPSD